MTREQYRPLAPRRRNAMLPGSAGTKTTLAPGIAFCTSCWILRRRCGVSFFDGGITARITGQLELTLIFQNWLATAAPVHAMVRRSPVLRIRLSAKDCAAMLFDW